VTDLSTPKHGRTPSTPEGGSVPPNPGACALSSAPACAAGAGPPPAPTPPEAGPHGSLQPGTELSHAERDEDEAAGTPA